MTHKAPISTDPFSGMYFIPTMSPTSDKCSWIAHSYIEKIYKAANQQAKILFKNGKIITLDISFGSMLNQVQRTAQLDRKSTRKNSSHATISNADCCLKKKTS